MQQAERMTRAVDGAIAQLQRLLGPEHVITDPHELAFYSHDVYRAGHTPAAVIRKLNAEWPRWCSAQG